MEFSQEVVNCKPRVQQNVEIWQKNHTEVKTQFLFYLGFMTYLRKLHTKE
jgi:hypothetical protein